MKCWIVFLLAMIAGQIVFASVEPVPTNRYTLEPLTATEVEVPHTVSLMIVAPPCYGPVRFGETLFSIATQLALPDVSLEQVMMAILDTNPQAFPLGNINHLLQGTLLQVPDHQAIIQRSWRDALTEVAQQHRQWKTSATKMMGH